MLKPYDSIFSGLSRHWKHESGSGRASYVHMANLHAKLKLIICSSQGLRVGLRKKWRIGIKNLPHGNLRLPTPNYSP